MNMEESNKKRDNLERAKTIMGKIDPELLTVALSEMMLEKDEAEEADVANAKEAIKGIYDSIPEGRDKKSILSKAITELDSDIIEKEVKAIKENLASIDKETIMEAAGECNINFMGQICRFAIGGPCMQPVGGCHNTVMMGPICRFAVSGPCMQPVGGCHNTVMMNP